MPFVPAASRRTVVPGMCLLVLASVVLAWCMAAVTTATATAAISPGSPQKSGRGLFPGGTSEKSPPLTLRSGSLPSPEALRSSQTIPRCLDSRQSETGLFLVPKRELPGDQLSGWLVHLRVQQPAASQLSLQVLFCTWQA